MKAVHARFRPARRRAVRAFVLTFFITVILLMSAWAGLVADARTRRVCDGRRAERIYTRLADAVRPPAVDFDDTGLPSAPTESDRTVYQPYPLRLLEAFLAALDEERSEGPGSQN
ncbi:MAG: hypothetical protein IKI63_05645 [Clostridia bacterium]|nr:hypothetical protein [Clostridia bacterium]